MTLGSIVPQAQHAGADLLVVTDGPDPAAARIAASHGARVLELPDARGLNAARNAAVRTVDSELIVFVDDDVYAHPGWLEALLRAAATAPDHGVFGGPITARLEGGGPRACGREPAPITTLNFGLEDRDVEFVWGANMAIRRRALEQVGPFDETIFIRGDEEDWQRRYRARGGRVRYVAGAALDHRRTETDSTTRRLARAAYTHGRAARRYDEHKGTAPPLALELRVLAGCAWHAMRRRCAFGIVMFVRTWGRLREAVAGRGT